LHIEEDAIFVCGGSVGGWAEKCSEKPQGRIKGDACSSQRALNN